MRISYFEAIFPTIWRGTAPRFKDLEKALCNQTRVTRSERIRSPVNVRQAQWAESTRIYIPITSVPNIRNGWEWDDYEHSYGLDHSSIAYVLAPD